MSKDDLKSELLLVVFEVVAAKALDVLVEALKDRETAHEKVPEERPKHLRRP